MPLPLIDGPEGIISACGHCRHYPSRGDFPITSLSGMPLKSNRKSTLDRPLPEAGSDLVRGSLQDAGPDSKHNAQQFVSVAEKVSMRVTALYGTHVMPRSDSTWTG